MSAEHETSLVIDCKQEGWDNILYDNLWTPRPIELRTLHSSYEPYMKQLAEMSSREFIMHATENRGEFTGRHKS